MTVSLGVAAVICIVLVVLMLLSSGLDLWGERLRRQTQRERWRKPNDPPSQR